MAHEPCGAVTRHVEFRHHANATVPGVGNHIADFILRVVQGVGAQFVKLRIFPALDAESLVLREVPVKNVHLHGLHAIEIPADDVERNEMAAGTAHQTPPWEKRLAWNSDHARGETA